MLIKEKSGKFGAMIRCKPLLFQNFCRLAFVVLFTIFFLQASAQTNDVEMKVKADKGFSLSASLLIPVGEFSDTHVLGFGVAIAPSAQQLSLFRKPKIGFTYNAGFDYYLGKNVTVSSYPYKYPGYFFIHAFAGAIYNPTKEFDIKLTAGPALGIYNGKTNFNIGSKLNLNYHFNNTIAIGTGLNMMKESGADPIWSVSLGATIALKQ